MTKFYTATFIPGTQTLAVDTGEPAREASPPELGNWDSPPSPPELIGRCSSDLSWVEESKLLAVISGYTGNTWLTSLPDLTFLSNGTPLSYSSSLEYATRVVGWGGH